MGIGKGAPHGWSRPYTQRVQTRHGAAEASMHRRLPGPRLYVHDDDPDDWGDPREPWGDPRDDPYYERLRDRLLGLLPERESRLAPSNHCGCGNGARMGHVHSRGGRFAVPIWIGGRDPGRISIDTYNPFYYNPAAGSVATGGPIIRTFADPVQRTPSFASGGPVTRTFVREPLARTSLGPHRSNLPHGCVACGKTMPVGTLVVPLASPSGPKWAHAEGCALIAAGTAAAPEALAPAATQEQEEPMGLNTAPTQVPYRYQADGSQKERIMALLRDRAMGNRKTQNGRAPVRKGYVNMTTRDVAKALGLPEHDVVHALHDLGRQDLVLFKKSRTAATRGSGEVLVGLRVTAKGLLPPDTDERDLPRPSSDFKAATKPGQLHPGNYPTHAEGGPITRSRVATASGMQPDVAPLFRPDAQPDVSRLFLPTPEPEDLDLPGFGPGGRRVDPRDENPFEAVPPIPTLADRFPIIAQIVGRKAAITKAAKLLDDAGLTDEALRVMEADTGGTPLEQEVGALVELLRTQGLVG